MVEMNMMKRGLPCTITVAPLTFLVQEVSSSPSQITIEMHMHDGPEVGHYMGDAVDWLLMLLVKLVE